MFSHITFSGRMGLWVFFAAKVLQPDVCCRSIRIYEEHYKQCVYFCGFVPTFSAFFGSMSFFKAHHDLGVAFFQAFSYQILYKIGFLLENKTPIRNACLNKK